ncbi:MAG: putative MutS2 protein [candidate division NC10 bacterium]|nr:putative MutS2 protein [candidate division NC10 bacterium]
MACGSRDPIEGPVFFPAVRASCCVSLPSHCHIEGNAAHASVPTIPWHPLSLSPTPSGEALHRMDTLDERTLALLEWPAIREMLAAEAASPVGSELARGVRPLHTLGEARRVQEEIGEFRVLLSKDTALPFDRLFDVSGSPGRKARSYLQWICSGSPSHWRRVKRSALCSAGPGACARDFTRSPLSSMGSLTW